MNLVDLIQVFVICAIIISGVAYLLSFLYSLFMPVREVNRKEENKVD